MWLAWLLLAFLVPIVAGDLFQAVEDCRAATYGLPGFRSQRNLLPQPDSLWNNVDKVAFQNADSTWLAANIRDTGSDFVVLLFGGALQHKEYCRSLI